MGEHEGWPQPSGLLPNGLLPNEAASVIRVVDSERWSKAEERTAELIACIQPNQPSEERRNAVADYVQRLITKCFPCQVFTFGSVPLKTYLPDGDIDLTAFSKNQNMKDTWANHVRDTLESEEKDENAEFRVKEVQYIQADVKLIKCLVENIVVDISFNQLGGLCTLCFLEEVDHLINQNHLFKRSIILIKAWCYYESRILGAHHGLISTYALETLVLYIFHVYNNSFAGPLEVLYRFLEFFSKFDWDNFCVSLWGPVPISSLPDVAAEPPRKDSGELLLSKLFLDACSSVYAVFPGGQENQGQPFVSKHFNVIDPLRINNNLGRSVSKGNFYRIRSAFAFGAKRLARLLDCPKEELYYEVNQFFMNTWDRHGSGIRPDAPRNNLPRLRLSTNSDHLHKPENLENKSSSKTIKENPSGRETEVEMNHVSHNISSQYGNHPLESTSRNSEVSTVSGNQNQKSYGNLNCSRISNQIIREVSADQDGHAEKGQRSSKPDHLVNDVQGRYLFARTRSSPELTDTYSDTSSRGRRNRAAESGKSQISAAGLDAIRKNLGSEIFANQNTKSSIHDPSSVRRIPSRQSLDTDAESNSASNSYRDDSGVVVVSEEPASAMGTQGMLQEEQDLVNMMASSMVPGFNGQVHMPMNLASPHFPFPLSQSILASMGYAQRNFAGMLPANFPLMEHPWGSNMQFPPGVVPSPMTHYFPGISLASNPEELIDTRNGKYGSVELSPEDAESDFWQEHDGGSTSGVDLDNGSLEMIHSDDQHPSTSANINPSSWKGVSGSSSRDQMKFTRENRGSTREDRLDSSQYPDNRGSEVYLDDRTVSPRIFPAVRTSSSRSKTSSENSWDGSSAKVSKAMKEKRGRKTASSIVSSSVYGKGKTVPEPLSNQGDEYDRDWNSLSTTSNELAERSTGPQAVAPLNVPRHHIPSLELPQTSVSDSLIPAAPMLLGPGSRQRAMDNSGAVPLTFYPTGPPVPFFTMLPVYNYPTETGSSETSSHFGGEEGLDNSDSGQNFDSSDGLDQSELLNVSSSMRRAASVEAPEEHKSDILNSDFASHWQNLQYGRFCQNPRYHGPMAYPSPVAVPPMYLQGRIPWDGPGRPLSTNMNLFTQIMSYGPRLVPATPLQSVSNRPSGVYQRYVEEMPRYRSGTGTYLPNPKASVRDRHPSGTRRGSYSYDRNDHHGDRSDREGNWNTNSKTRAAGRNHSRSQAERSSSRLDRLAANESRADRPWTSYRPDSFHSYQSQNGPLRSNATQSSSGNVAYGMYPLQAVNPNGTSSNGPTVMMLYPYDHNASYGSTAEQLEFGSLGPVGFPGMNEVSHLSEGSRSSGAFEEQRFHNSSVQLSSPDQPSSPLIQRRH